MALSDLIKKGRKKAVAFKKKTEPLVKEGKAIVKEVKKVGEEFRVESPPRRKGKKRRTRKFDDDFGAFRFREP